MGIEEKITDLQRTSAEQTAASQALSQEVAGKMGEIDERVNIAESDFNKWKSTTSYVKKYSVTYAEQSKEVDRNTGNYNLIKLYTVTNAYSAINPWIHLGWSGGNQVGTGHFCSLAQSHANYTGQQAMFARRGSGDIKFFIDRTHQANAHVYIALKNQNFNNASMRLDMASSMALTIEPKGAVNLDAWLVDNPNVIEIELIDITL
ncbi:conserved hypothetical protein [Vibrio crassostreae]|nr:conserved hypothetical protein [Vibrio crassostreae]CAK3648091.1 conserved hypothetical protein [Vibrio crassostreae]